MIQIPLHVRLALAELQARQRLDPLAICLVVALLLPLTITRSGDKDAINKASPRYSIIASRRNASKRRGLAFA
jgi:hypothetical protein